LEQLALELRELRLELRVEPGEVELVQLPQIGPIGGVHVVEPLHELVGELVAEGILAECTLGAAAEARDLTPCPRFPSGEGERALVSLTPSPLSARRRGRQG